MFSLTLIECSSCFFLANGCCFTSSEQFIRYIIDRKKHDDVRSIINKG